jgi:hypothetical protein
LDPKTKTCNVVKETFSQPSINLDKLDWDYFFHHHHTNDMSGALCSSCTLDQAMILAFFILSTIKESCVNAREKDKKIII